jgi:hypothetical protein
MPAIDLTPLVVVAVIGAPVLLAFICGKGGGDE